MSARHAIADTGREVGDDHHGPPVEAVAQRPAERRQKARRAPRQKQRRRHPRRRAGGVVDRDHERDVRGLAARQRDESGERDAADCGAGGGGQVSSDRTAARGPRARRKRDARSAREPRRQMPVIGFTSRILARYCAQAGTKVADTGVCKRSIFLTSSKHARIPHQEDHASQRQDRRARLPRSRRESDARPKQAPVHHSEARPSAALSSAPSATRTACTPWTGTRSTSASWRLDVRCPDCRWMGSDVFAQDEVERYDDLLSADTDALIDELERITRAEHGRSPGALHPRARGRRHHADRLLAPSDARKPPGPGPEQGLAPRGCRQCRNCWSSRCRSMASSISRSSSSGYGMPEASKSRA